MRAAAQQLQVAPERVTPALASQMTELLRLAPLASEPFTLAAYIEHVEDEQGRANQLVAIAKRRDPRSREALVLAVDAGLAAENIAAAVESLETLMRLEPSQRAILDQSLILLASHPDTRLATLASVQDDASKRIILTGLAQAGADPASILAARNEMRAKDQLRGDPGMINQITKPYMAAGDYLGAYRLWSELVGYEPAGATVRDKAFSRNLPPPFGWDIQPGRDGFIANEGPGLRGEVYGRRRATLARQHLVLPRGRFSLVIDFPEPADLIEVSVRCLTQPRAVIASVRLREAAAGSLTFEVPGDCAAQMLEINARASDPPRSQPFAIASVTIR
jgi:hypothetical protein